MSYLSELQWFNDFERYDENTKQILMALSEREYKVRNLKTIYKVSGMRAYTVDAIIKNLERDGVVYVQRNDRTNNIVVGLTETRPTLPTSMLVYTINGVVHDSFVIEYTKKNTDNVFRDYIKKRLPVRVYDHIDDIITHGYYSWEDSGSTHVVNVTNTKIIPS